MSEIYGRKETKYEIDAEDYRHLRTEVTRHLPLFEFRPRRPYTYISTVYFDTQSSDFYHRARRSYDNSLKLRIKEYYYRPGDRREPETFPHCFIEIKERAQGQVYKRRLRVPKSLIKPLLSREDIWAQLVAKDPGIEFQESAYRIYREIRDFLQLNEVDAHTIINYRRVVYQRDEEELRVTFDDQLQIFRPIPGLFEAIEALTREALGTPIRRIRTSIMEIKCPDRYPLWLENALGSHYPRKISKFTTSIDFLKSHLQGDGGVEMGRRPVRIPPGEDGPRAPSVPESDGSPGLARGSAPGLRRVRGQARRRVSGEPDLEP